MLTGRCKHGISQLGQFIYALGGVRGKTAIN